MNAAGPFSVWFCFHIFSKFFELVKMVSQISSVLLFAVVVFKTESVGFSQKGFKKQNIPSFQPVFAYFAVVV